MKTASKQRSKQRKAAPPTKKPVTAAVEGEQKFAPPSPRTGYRLPVGAHPGNTGGKKGRSGRKPDEFRRALEEVRDVKGMNVLTQILDGEVTYTLRGACEHCGKASNGPDMQALAKLIPSPDTRLRAVEHTLRFTLPTEKIVRLEGLQGAQRAFEVIKTRIRARLAPPAAEELIEDIHQSLKGS